MKPGLAFDLDGVLIHSERHWKAVSHEFLRGHIPTWSHEDQRGIWGLSARVVYQRLIERYGLSLSWDEYLKSYDVLAQQIYGELAEPCEGALEFLAYVSHAGYPVVLVTSAPKRWATMVLERFGVLGRFQNLVTVDDVGNESKPHPRPYSLAAELLKIPPGQCLAFEDSPKGLQSAKAAGFCCVALRSDGATDSDFADASAVLSSFQEIPIRNFDSWLRRLPNSPILS